MKKSIIPGIVISIMLLFVSCDMDSIFSGNTTVRISVKPLVNEKVLQNSASRALLSFNEQTITLKAEADGMTPITQTLVFDSSKNTFSGSVTIEKGKNVTFTVEAKDAKGTVYVKGSETKTLLKTTESVAITLVPVLSDPGVNVTQLDFTDTFEGAVNGEVKAVAFAPMPFDVTYTYEASNVAVTVCNREGKTLVNTNNEWNMKKGEEFIILYTITGEKPMIHVYPKLVTVTFDANGGNGTMTPQTMNANVPTTLSPNTFTKDGYVFAAWCDAPDPVQAGYVEEGNFDFINSSHFFLNTFPITIYENITLYALWLPSDLVTISFDANGGDGSMDYIGAAVGDTVTLPQNSFTKTGHTFAYWLAVGYENLGPIHNGTDFFVPGDVTLVAQWAPDTIPSETVTITFNANGGIGTMADLPAISNTKIALTTNTFIKEGFEFLCWTTYAAPYDGSFFNADGNFVYDEKFFDAEGNLIIDESKFFLDEQEISVAADTPLYALWISVQDLSPVTISFDANGGDGSMDYIGAAVGDTVTLPQNSFTKTGHTFAYWLAVGYENLGPIHNGTDFFVPGDVTLCAQWAPDTIPSETVTITFNANGGTGTMAPQVITPGVATALTANTFTKDGYVFIGWYRDTPLADDPTEEDMDFVLYYLDEDEMILEDLTPDMIFYAIWETELTGTLNLEIEIPGPEEVIVNSGNELGSVPIDGTIEINSSITLSNTSMLLNGQSLGPVEAAQTMTINLSDHNDKVQTGENTLTLVYDSNGTSYSKLIYFTVE